MRRLLIVDDDQRFRAIARELLENEGFEVVGEAGDGATGIAAVRSLEPEVVLLDVQLPDIDGIELAKRLTGNGGGPAVILTSTRDASDYGSEVARSGARGFVPKDELSAERIVSLCE
jgi:DNA-binding NarL/FixJ family response regulator